jgi:hypothetical protein
VYERLNGHDDDEEEGLQEAKVDFIFHFII